jgi:hypothetical protein
VSHFVVKAAARRVLLMGLRAEDPEFSVIHGHRPRLWPGLDGSLRRPAGHGAAVAGLVCGQERVAAGPDRSGRRRLEGAAAVVQTVAVVTGRVHPLDRAARPLLRSGGSMPKALLMRRMPSCMV